MEFLAENAGSLCAGIGAVTAVTGAAATYYLAKMPGPTCIPPVDLNDQSDVLEDGVTRCSKLLPKGQLLQYPFEDVKTMYESFQRGLRISRHSPCLGARTGPNLEFEWLTYTEVYENALAFGSWMLDQGIKQGAETIIGIFSINRMEWVFTEQACNAYTIIPVALYDTLGDQATLYIINQTQMSLVVCDTVSKANRLLQTVGEAKSLKTIVVMDGCEGVAMETADKHGITIISYQDTLIKGKQNLKSAIPPTPEDIALICYTSGTTGDPKGVVFRHKNIMANCAAILMMNNAYREYDEHDVHLSYLPLPHMFERLGQVIFFAHGVRIGFFRGDVKLLLEDLQALKPTLFFAVPRLLNRLYDKIMAGAQSSRIKSTLLNLALAAKMRELNKYVIRKDSIWDKLVFRKVQAALGGRVKFIVTGSAPLERKVLTFMRCAFGCAVFEAYGQTEAVAGITFTVAGETEAGHVGPPLPCNFVKLVDVPEDGYYAANGEGEICAKGNNIGDGYYKQPEKTAETIDAEGWLHTGDIGKWLPNGTLKVIDRKKNLFKLAQGEYIAPEKIETVYLRCTFVAQIFVDGDSLEAYIMCVVVPDEEVLMAWAKKQGLKDSFGELCKSESVKDMILNDMNKVGRDAGLKSFELTRDVFIQAELFSVENELLTPTFKNKRPSLRKYFKSNIQALYAKHSASQQ